MCSVRCSFSVFQITHSSPQLLSLPKYFTPLQNSARLAAFLFPSPASMYSTFFPLLLLSSHSSSVGWRLSEPLHVTFVFATIVSPALSFVRSTFLRVMTMDFLPIFPITRLTGLLFTSDAAAASQSSSIQRGRFPIHARRPKREPMILFLTMHTTQKS